MQGDMLESLAQEESTHSSLQVQYAMEALVQRHLTSEKQQAYRSQHLVCACVAGQKRLDAVLQDAASQRNGSSTASVNGAAAFELYDTYGFPLELTEELAAEQGIDVSPRDNQLLYQML